MSKRALGKGIGALISSGGQDRGESSGVVEVRLASITPNPKQPRREFSDASLAELAESIKRKGVLQPVLVEEGRDGLYTLIAGERRVRAARIAGLEKIPVIIRQFSQQEKLEIALIENIQREDLTPIEEAQAYKSLMDSSGSSQEEVAAQVGKDRSTIANSLRLLRLSMEMQRAVDRAEVSPGHARAILAVVNPADQEVLFRRILEQGISVRQAEQMVVDLNRGKKSRAKKTDGERSEGGSKREPEIREIEERLIERLGTKVQIKGTAAKGRIEIFYFSSDDLERISDLTRGK